MRARTRGWTREWRGGVLLSVALGLAALALPAGAQFPDALSESECPGCRAPLVLATFEGTWSSALTAIDEPRWPLEEFFCFAACTAEGRADAVRLLTGAQTAQRPALELYPKAVAANVRSVERLATVTSDPSRPLAGRLPGFSCDRLGLAAQVVSPLPLAIETEPGRVTLRYEELGAQRTILLGGHAATPHDEAPFGLSKGWFERGVLVVETSGIPAGRLSGWLGGFAHSDALHAVERYSVSADGRWLELVLTLDDHATLAKPLVVTKRWLRTPEARLMRYGCDVMSEGLEGVFAEYLDPRVIDARRRSSMPP